jgi:hypothetical protein
MASSNQSSDNMRKKGDKSQRPSETDQQNQGGQRSHTDQQHQGHRDSGGGQQTGGSHGHDHDMNRKDTSK